MDERERLDLAANSLRGLADIRLRQGMKGAATIALDGNDATANVVDDWFSQEANLKSIPLDIDPSSLEERQRRYTPVVFPHRYRTIKSRGTKPDKCIVLIALEDLSFRNGLMKWTRKGEEEKKERTIPKAGWTWFRGDQEWEQGENGGGLAIWLELQISQASQS